MIIAVAVVVIFWAYNLYVSVIKKKNKVMEAFSGISVQLKKRYDLIPNILTIANKFMEHEKGLMEEVTALRTKAMSLPNDLDSLGKKLALDAEIKSKMGQIMVAVENYTQLKSDQTMMTECKHTMRLRNTSRLQEDSITLPFLNSITRLKSSLLQ